MLLRILFFTLICFLSFTENDNTPPDWLWDDSSGELKLMKSSSADPEREAEAVESLEPEVLSTASGISQDAPSLNGLNWKSFYSSIKEMKLSLNSMFQKKEYEDFLQKVDLLLMEDRDNREFLYKKAFALSKLKKYKDSLLAYNKLLEFYPAYRDAWYEKGIVQKHLGSYETALESLNKAISLKLNQTWIYYDRGIIQQKMGEVQGALDSFLKAEEISSKNQWAILEIANIYFSRRQYVHAMQYYQKVKEIAPNTPGLKARMDICVKRLEQ